MMVFQYLNSSEIKETYPSVCNDVVGNPDIRALRKKNLKKTNHSTFKR